MAPDKPAKRKPILRTYLAQSRDTINGLVLVAPLFVIYQVGILFTDGWKNGADFVTGGLLAAVDGNLIYYTALNLVVLAIMLGVYLYRRKSHALAPRTFPMVVGESTLYAFFMGGIASAILYQIGLRPPLSLHAAASGVPAATATASMGPIDSIVLSIGAGTYEELLFRLIMLGGLWWALQRFTTLGKMKTAVIAVLVTSLIFSAFHYQPIGMEAFQLYSFTFRFILGIILAVLYVTRGFAVAVYTHAIYDIFILLPRSLGL